VRRNTAPAAQTTLAANYCKFDARANVRAKVKVKVKYKVTVRVRVRVKVRVSNLVICCQCGQCCPCGVSSHTWRSLATALY